MPRRSRRSKGCARAAQSQTTANPEPSRRSRPRGRRRPARKVRPAVRRTRRARSRLRQRPAQKLDVYIPEGAKHAPILFMVHGGGWMLGDKGNSGVVANKVKHWLPRAYIVVSPNYRMARPPNPLEQTEDVGRALAFVQANAASWGGDGSRIVLMGHSSGAHLVTLLTAAPGRGSASPGPSPGSARCRSTAPRSIVGRAHERAPSSLLRPGVRRRAGALDRGVAAAPAVGPSRAAASGLLQPPQRFLSRRPSLCRQGGLPGGRATVLPLDLNHGEINSELGRSDRATRRRSTSFCARSGCPDRRGAAVGLASDTRRQVRGTMIGRKAGPLPQISAGRRPLNRRVVLA